MKYIPETDYAVLFSRYKEASMLADKYELISKTQQSVNESLRATNDDLRRMLLEKSEESEKLRELVRAAWKCIHSGLSCSDCRLVAGGCTLESAMRELGVEVEG